MTIIKLKRFILIIVSLFACWTTPVFAGTYWVSLSGTSAWDDCQSVTPLSGTSACAYSTANTNAATGDTIYYRGGTYNNITGSAINPSNTGTAGNVITFSAYNNETVEFVGSGLSSWAINLNSDYGTVRSYIKVYGLKFTNFMYHLWILKGEHNEISYCTFLGFPPEATLANFKGVWSASKIYRQAQYNWIHHNTFGNWGACEPYGNDTGVVIEIGHESSATDYTKYNVFENNTAYHGGHHVVSLNGTNNVFRNNYFYNDPWCPVGSPQYSTRIAFQTGVDGDCKYNLVEGNRFAYGGPKNKDEIGGTGSTISGAYNIWRKNVFAQIYTKALWVTYYSGQTDTKYNKFYNNTFWHGGYGRAQSNINNWMMEYTHGIVVAEGNGALVYGNDFKNNLFYQHSAYYGTAYSIIKYGAGTYGIKVPEYQTLSSNWFDNAGDPKFVDISGTPDPTNGDQWNFRLQPSSLTIDKGAFLTTITSASGSGTSFTVADAGYFFDGWGIAAHIPNASIIGDTIQLSGKPQTAVITAIDYATNTVTVNTELTWTKGQGIALAYEGIAPDIGAYEFLTKQPSPLINLRKLIE